MCDKLDSLNLQLIHSALNEVGEGMETAQGGINSINKRTKHLVEQAGGPTVSD